MSHNESQAVREIEEQPVKPSKLKKVRSAVTTAGIFGIPAAVTVVGAYYGIRTSKLQLETAKLANEAAKLALKK